MLKTVAKYLAEFTTWLFV